MLLLRAREGVLLGGGSSEAEEGTPTVVHAVFFLVSAEDQPGQHLRLLGHLATHVDDDTFLAQWLSAGSEHELRETLLREERSISVHVDTGSL